MREIKFRAWIKDEKKMLFSPCLDSNDLADRSMADFWRIAEDFTTYKDDVVAMQFTGLVDKNGREIYEGDVVRDGKLLNVIEYWTDHGLWEMVNKAPLKTGFYNAPLNKPTAEDLEVVGNVYENPKLVPKR